MKNTDTYIYGFHAILSLIETQPSRIMSLMMDEKRKDARMAKILDLASQHSLPIKQVARQTLDHVAATSHHQGIVAMITPQQHPTSLENFLDELDSPFLLILDGVQDPHNLGACLRTANAAGVDAVIAPKDRAAGITPIVTKVASGAVEATPFFQVTNLARTLTMLKDRGIWLYGTSDAADKLYTEVDFRGSIAIVMGAEEKGLRRLTEDQCDFLIRIPMFGAVSSLNVSVATGIFLFEVVRQHARS